MSNGKMEVIKVDGGGDEVKNMMEMVRKMIVIMNSQSEKKEEKSDKLCNVEVEQLLSKFTLSDLLLFPQSLQHGLSIAENRRASLT